LLAALAALEADAALVALAAAAADAVDEAAGVPGGAAWCELRPWRRRRRCLRDMLDLHGFGGRSLVLRQAWRADVTVG
jgi:hypothetical protein